MREKNYSKQKWLSSSFLHPLAQQHRQLVPATPRRGREREESAGERACGVARATRRLRGVFTCEELEAEERREAVAEERERRKRPRRILLMLPQAVVAASSSTAGNLSSRTAWRRELRGSLRCLPSPCSAMLAVEDGRRREDESLPRAGHRDLRPCTGHPCSVACSRADRGCPAPAPPGSRQGPAGAAATQAASSHTARPCRIRPPHLTSRLHLRGCDRAV
jgi:hypothetical protein